MTNSDEKYPPDDFVIGESFPPPPGDPELEGDADGVDEIGATPADRWGSGGATTPVIDDDEYYPEEPEDGDLYYDDDELYEDQPAIGAGYYYDDYDDAPARQPIFYVFIGIAVLLGGLFIYLLFSVFGNGDNGGGNGLPSDPDFNILIASPADDAVLQVEEDVEVLVQANSTERIARIELYANEELADMAEFEEEPDGGVYSAALTVLFPETGNYDLFARAVSVSGESNDSETIRVRVVELVDEEPASITGELITTVNARTGPGDDFPTARTYDAGEDVVLIGKNANSEWVLLEDNLWIRAAAVRLNDSLALLRIVRPTPTPAPTNTPEPEPSETATPDQSNPDLAPVNASLAADGSILRVTIENRSSTEYEGPLVVAAVGLPEGDVQEAFLVSIPGSGSQSVDLDLPEPNTEGGTVRITVDVGNNIEESNEDNNQATFVLAASVDPPEFTIQAQVNGAQTVVTVTNVGGRLESSQAYVAISLGGTNSSPTSTITLENGQSAQFTVSTPTTAGTAQVTLFVNDEPVATGSLEIPGDEEPTATPEATEEPTAENEN